MDIRDCLEAIIREKGYKQVAVADKAGMTPMQLSKVLDKSRKLDANELFAICDAIEMTPMEVKNYLKEPA